MDEVVTLLHKFSPSELELMSVEIFEGDLGYLADLLADLESRMVVIEDDTRPRYWRTLKLKPQQDQTCHFMRVYVPVSGGHPVLEQDKCRGKHSRCVRVPSLPES